MTNKLICRSIIILSVVLTGFLFWSCGADPYKEFMRKVDSFGAVGKISVEEWSELTDFVEAHLDIKKFNRFVTNDTLDKQYLINYLENKGLVIEKPIPSQAKTVNIYIENSGSMFGFVNGNTGFKNVLTKLIVDLKSKGYPEDDIKFHFINRTITPIAITGKIEDYPISLSATVMRDKDSNDSDINTIYKQILENTSADNLSILLSDCIYSIHQDIKNDDVEGALRIWKTKTVGVFNDVIKEKKLSTLFVQLTSDFTGNYYTRENKPIYFDKQPIFYYMTVIGNENELNNFDFVEALDGFQNKLALTTQDYSENTYYSLIQTMKDNGQYKPIRSKRSNLNIVHSIEGIRFQGRENGPFVFSLAVDLSKLPIDGNYVTEQTNFTIEKGDYEIVSILPFDKNILIKNTLKKLEQANIVPTHIIIFKSTSNGYSDLVFSLKKKIPEWVYRVNTNDDSDIKANSQQTFGLKYLVEGMFEAYQNSSQNKDYITFTINIKR